MARTKKSHKKVYVKLSKNVKKPRTNENEGGDKHALSVEYSTIKMSLLGMVDSLFYTNLNDVAVRASKVAILGSLNVVYEFYSAFNAADFDKVERLSTEIKSYPQRSIHWTTMKWQTIISLLMIFNRNGRLALVMKS